MSEEAYFYEDLDDTVEVYRLVCKKSGKPYSVWHLIDYDDYPTAYCPSCGEEHDRLDAFNPETHEVSKVGSVKLGEIVELAKNKQEDEVERRLNEARRILGEHFCSFLYLPSKEEAREYYEELLLKIKGVIDGEEVEE